MAEEKTPANSNSWQKPQRGWLAKFVSAFRGIGLGMQGQSSFIVHLLITIAVLVWAGLMRIPMDHWCLLILCIGVVIAAELFNSSLEFMARAITNAYDPNIETGLDIASAAVLVLAIAAALVGLAILCLPLLAS